MGILIAIFGICDTESPYIRVVQVMILIKSCHSHLSGEEHWRNVLFQNQTIDVLSSLKALTNSATFLATYNAILLLRDVKLANTCYHHRLLVYS